MAAGRSCLKQFAHGCPFIQRNTEGMHFVRMFPFKGLRFPEEEIRWLTAPGGPLDVVHASRDQNNERISSGFTYLGQFLDHDITFDSTTSILSRQNPDQVHNARTPVIDLMNLYGQGPILNPYFYEKDGATLVFGSPGNSDYDVARNPVGVAIIGDPRNDENLFVNQLHLAYLKFHNQVVKDLAPKVSNPSDLFEEAAQIVRWHQQWIVLHEFLPLFIGEDLLAKILDRGPQFYKGPGIPIEFSAAAYRMGHATVRQSYDVNDEVHGVQLFDAHQPGTPINPRDRVQWNRFFAFPEAPVPQSCKKFGPFVASELLQLPVAAIPGFEHKTLPDGRLDPLFLSLPGRNLLRSNEFELPSGQAIAREIGAPVLTNQQLGLDPTHWRSEEAPLWYYILKEGELLGNGGSHLGPVGGTIVGEVFVGIIQNDANSYVNKNPSWTPNYGSNGTFTMAHLVQIADAYKRNPAITTIPDLKEHLQAAVALELATIPPYLCGWWSIKDRNNPCAALIKSIVLDEMKHLTIAANCLIAIGGNPNILEAAPSYPSYLPDGETEFKVSLLPFGQDFLVQAMKIEAPKPRAAIRALLGSPRTTMLGSLRPTMLGMGDRYVTIGEFYQAIIDGISHLVATFGETVVFPRGHDVTNQVKTFGVTVSDSQTATKLLKDIVSEGEGETATLIWDERGKIAHFYAFDEIARGQEYQRGDQPGMPSGPSIAVPLLTDVYQMIRDPKMEDYPEGSDVFNAAEAFNHEYAKLLHQLQRAFNGQPAEINTAIEQMSLLSKKAVAVFVELIPGKPEVTPGPTFEPPRFLPSASSSE